MSHFNKYEDHITYFNEAIPPYHLLIVNTMRQDHINTNR